MKVVGERGDDKDVRTHYDEAISLLLGFPRGQSDGCLVGWLAEMDGRIRVWLGSTLSERLPVTAVTVPVPAKEGEGKRKLGRVDGQRRRPAIMVLAPTLVLSSDEPALSSRSR